MKYLSFFVVILALQGCIIDYVSSASSTIQNNTNHVIQINAYKNGDIDADMSFTVAANAKIVNNETLHGKASGMPLGVYFQPFDSVVVIFDGIKSSRHNRFTDSTICPKCISFSSDRAISNDKNWTKNVLFENRHRMETAYLFTFTEQDYLMAK